MPFKDPDRRRQYQRDRHRAAAAEARAAEAEATKPTPAPPGIDASAWAAEHVVLPPQSSYLADDSDGRYVPWTWQAVFLEFLFNPLGPRKVTLRKSARIGATKTVVAAAAYAVCVKGWNSGIWHASQDDARAFALDSVQPLFEAGGPLSGYPVDATTKRSSTWKMESMVFRSDNGRLAVLHTRYAGSEKQNRRLQLTLAIVDECDSSAMDLGNYGDPIAQAHSRIKDSGRRGRLVSLGTPGVEGGTLHADEQAADLTLAWSTRCPDCGGWAAFTVHDLVDQGGVPHLVHGVDGCGALLPRKAVQEAPERWQSEAGDYVDGANMFDVQGDPRSWPRHVALSINASTGSPMLEWDELLASRVAAEADPAKLKVHINNDCGDYWRLGGQRVDITVLMTGRRSFQRDLKVLCVAGVDVQANRIEATLVEWREPERARILRHFVLMGDTADSAPWDALAAALAGIKPNAVFVDAGFRSEHTYLWCDRTAGAWPVKGKDIQESYWEQSLSSLKHAKPLIRTGSQVARATIFGRMAQGSWFEFDASLPESFFRGLLCEVLETDKSRRGRRIPRYTAPASGGNEPIACLAYSFCGQRYLRERLGWRFDRPGPAPIRRHNIRFSQ